MSRGYWIHRAARAEFKRAIEFYRVESPELAETFVEEVQATIDLLCERPLMGTPASAGLRAKHLIRFPYTLFYRDGDDEVQIFAIAHQRRKPGYWLKRVQ